MRIVQTFWTGGRSPKEHSFGWLHPEYNLMSWALSCLSLREHYDEVALYTDKEGYKVLIEELKLPYTEVHVEYDEHLCLPQHWAYSKIKTYSLQTEPFLHIDGDIYLPKPLSESVIDAPLVAQNREIGTDFYKRMVDEIMKHRELAIRNTLISYVQKESVLSYNMGVFGGTNIAFIKDYCREVSMFMKRNQMNDKNSPTSFIQCNVFMEQMYFSFYADSYNQKVSTVFTKQIKDNGYTVQEFCNLEEYEFGKFFHLLGGHKRNLEVIKMLERLMLRKYSDIYLHILSLFPQRHPRVQMMNHEVQNESIFTVEHCLAQYEDFFEDKFEEWKNLSFSEIFKIEKQMAHISPFAKERNGTYLDVFLKRPPYSACFPIPKEWHPKAIELLRLRLNNKEKKIAHIILFPSLGEHGIRECAISELRYMVYSKLPDRATPLERFLNEIMSELKITDDKAMEGVRRSLYNEIIGLHLLGGVVLINKEDLQYN